MFEFIKDHSVRHRVRPLCRVLGVSRSGFYSFCQRPPSARKQANDILVAQIAEIHRQSHQTYGSPRMYHALRQRGLRASRKRVARLMRLHHIRARTKRRFKVTTRSRHAPVITPDLVQRRFQTLGPNMVWTSDITYVWTREGWVYLAVVLDLYSRLIVGWDLSDRLTADLITSALGRAVDRRQPESRLIFHSDRGRQYDSQEVRSLLDQHNMRPSMGETGSCYDNAVTESFFHTLKTEHTFFERYQTREEARHSIFQYIEVFYNRQRLHSTIGNLSPWQFEQQHSP